MNQHTKWRMEVAGKISASLRSFSGIQAIMVGGSVARGYADAFSDLELLIYWKGAPDKKVQQDIIKALNLERRYPAMDIGYDNAFWIDGFPVDIWHKDLADEEGVIEKVIGGFSLDLGHSNVLDTLQSGVALHGAEVLQPWKERAALYPEELAVRFLDAYLPHFHLKQLLYAVERDNPSAFYSILSAIQSSLFLILLALNKSYFPTYKWMFERLAELPLKPDQLEFRLKQMYKEPPRAAASQLYDVLKETLLLVENRYPQLDTAFARYGLNQPVPSKYTPQ